MTRPLHRISYNATRHPGLDPIFSHGERQSRQMEQLLSRTNLTRDDLRERVRAALQTSRLRGEM